MSNKLAIVGFGGHYNVIVDIARRNNFVNIDIFDDHQHHEDVKGDLNLLIKNKHLYDKFFIAIGDNEIRQKIYKKL